MHIHICRIIPPGLTPAKWRTAELLPDGNVAPGDIPGYGEFPYPTGKTVWGEDGGGAGHWKYKCNCKKPGDQPPDEEEGEGK